MIEVDELLNNTSKYTVYRLLYGIFHIILFVSFRSWYMNEGCDVETRAWTFPELVS